MLRTEAIVWDLDGTLVDTAPDLVTALNTILDKSGIAGLSLNTVREMVGEGAQKLIERGFKAGGVPVDADQLGKLTALFIEVYTECATDNSRPFPQIVDTLKQLHELNIPMGVCTNKPEALSRQILDGLDLSRYFSSVVGGDTLPTRKPDPQPLLRCLHELATEPQASLMIGDSIIDVKAAHAAGVVVGVVPWGYRSQAIETLGADFILEDLAELQNFVRVLH
jgi:phosphoglycolate phosphatase